MPPFGRALLELAAEQDVEEVRVLFGASPWREARHLAEQGRPVLVLPPGAQPQKFFWPVRGREVLAVQRGACARDEIPALGKELINAGALKVFVLYPLGRRTESVIYRPSR